MEIKTEEVMEACVKKRIKVTSFEKRQEYRIKEKDIFTAFIFAEIGLASFYIIQNKAMFMITLKKDEYKIV